jgi:hypothetical protein
MPKKKLKPNLPVVTDLPAEDVELALGLLRDDKQKVKGISETFNRFLPKDRNGVVEVTTSVNNFGKTLSTVPVAQLRYKRLVWDK